MTQDEIVEVRGALARGYCSKENEHKVLDPELIESMALEVDKVFTTITHSIEKKTAKAFGGCTKCYGKGYSTVIQNVTAHADFIGDTTTVTELDRVHPCSCDRGKQIEEMRHSIEKKHVEKMGEIMKEAKYVAEKYIDSETGKVHFLTKIKAITSTNEWV